MPRFSTETSSSSFDSDNRLPDSNPLKLKATLKFFTSVFFFWVVFFMAFRVIFLTYHSLVFSRFPIGEKLQVLWHGAYMDASMAGYASMIPFLDSSSAPAHSHNLLSQPPHSFAFYSFRYGNVFLQDGKRNELLDPSVVSGPASWYRQWVFESF